MVLILIYFRHFKFASQVSAKKHWPGTSWGVLWTHGAAEFGKAPNIQTHRFWDAELDPWVDGGG